MGIKIDFPKREDIKKCFELDNEIFNVAVNDEVGISLDTVEGWYDINKYQWLIAKDEDENVLGWIGFYHIKLRAFERLAKGEINEKDLTDDDFLEFRKGNNICCHIAGFSVKQNNTRVAVSLLNKSLSYFKFLKENGINIHKLSAFAISAKGIMITEKLGFKKVLEYNKLDNGVIPKFYAIDLSNEHEKYPCFTNAIKDIFLENDKYL